MEREGLNALIIFGEHEDSGPATVAYDTWFTNVRAGTTIIFPVTGDPVSLLPMTGDPVSLLPMTTFTVDHLESSRRGDTVWIPAKNLRLYSASRQIIDTVKELSLGKGTIGVVGLEP